MYSLKQETADSKVNELLHGLPGFLPRENCKDLIDGSNKIVMNLDNPKTENCIKTSSNSATEFQNLEKLLLTKVNEGVTQSAFQLGQLYFYEEDYNKAWKYFKISFEEFKDPRAAFQLGVILYDGLVDESLTMIKNPKMYACKLFEELLTLDTGSNSPIGQRELVYSAAYNLGRAYHQGFGPYPSNEAALKYFLFAAHDGDPKASILAQTALGYLYAGPDFNDLQKSFYWHTEACGNGSVESQAAIGVMYLHGLGVQQSTKNALYCLSEASERGSLYARANLIYLYYKRKMFTNACYLASDMVNLTSDKAICQPEQCLQTFQNRAKAMACFLYGLCLQKGQGVAKDENLAMELLSKSTEYDVEVALRYKRMVIDGDL